MVLEGIDALNGLCLGARWMDEPSVGHFHAQAVADFRRARTRAKVEQIVARLRGESADLFEYEEVRKKFVWRTKRVHLAW